MAASERTRETITLPAVATEDERQLDGRRYLELVAEHPERPLELALRLVVSRDGMLDEAELILVDSEANTAIPFETPVVIGTLEPLELRLSGTFADIRLVQAEDGDYTLQLSLNQSANDSEGCG